MSVTATIIRPTVADNDELTAEFYNETLVTGVQVPTGNTAETVCAGNDYRLPLVAQRAALNGSNGTPGDTNRFVTNSDPRLVDSRKCNGTFDDAATARANLGVIDAVLQVLYPIGSLFMSANSTMPALIAGLGTWTKVSKGRSPIFVDEGDADFASVGNRGGEKNHTLTSNEIPNHSHDSGSLSGSTNSAGDHSHNATLTGNTSSDGYHYHNLNASGTTSSNGDHYHDYKDAYFAMDANQSPTGDTVGIPNNKGSSGGTDTNNEGWQMSRSTSTTGAHTHSVTITGFASDAGTHSHSVSVSGSTATTGAHSHSVSLSGNTGSAGGGGSHNNMHPYEVIGYLWKRTA